MYAEWKTDRSAFKILTGTPAGKRLLGRPIHRWEDNIGVDLKEIGINKRNCVDLAQDRNYWRALVNAVLEHLGSLIHGVSSQSYDTHSDMSTENTSRPAYFSGK